MFYSWNETSLVTILLLEFQFCFLKRSFIYSDKNHCSFLKYGWLKSLSHSIGAEDLITNYFCSREKEI
ncbi:unnamed protein product [Blepharisma stoltei]|uniref:Uncharacterized protein n=1 Tax=Blepharisma stoltei TaxID=1481888 RepID=A0AAU9JGD2_9CILI|nr:unnamed protein product [Blepharisma stoltei]